MKTALLDINKNALLTKGLYEEERSVINAAYAISRGFSQDIVDRLIERAIEATYTRNIFQNIVVNQIFELNNITKLHFYNYKIVDDYGSVYLEIYGDLE